VAVAASTFSSVVLNSLTFHRNPGGQTGFAASGVAILPSASLPSINRLAAADVDRNGIPDVIALALGRAFVATSDGGGTFTPDPGNPYVTPPMFTPGDVAVGDVDGDNNVDFVTVGHDSLSGGSAGDVFLNLAPDDTVTGISSAPNPSSGGQSFTLTATVATVVPTFPAAGPPTGTVDFVSGETVLGSAPIVGGVATVTVSGLAPGSYPITAVYTSSSPAIRSSTSLPHTHVVSGSRAFRYEATGGTDVTGAGAARVASGSFSPDGVPDIVIGSGIGKAARVQVIDGSSRQVLTDMSPFGDFFAGGIFVAAGDVDGDGTADVAVTADVGGGPRVVVLLSRAGQLSPVVNFLALDPTFRGGLRVALGDLNRDGFADLVVTPGPGGGPRVATYDGRSLRAGSVPARLWNDFFAVEAESRMGLFVAAGDVNGDGFGDVVIGAEFGGGPRVVAFDGAGLAAGPVVTIVNFFSGSPEERSGVRVAARDLDGDGSVELLTGSGPGVGSRVRIYAASPERSGGGDPVLLLEVDAFPGLTTGVYVA
jgi:hypothetical protein